VAEEQANEVVEILFRGERKDVFVNPSSTPVGIGEHVIAQVERGEDMGRVLQKGGLAEGKGRSRHLRQVIRKATEEDMAKLRDNEKLEEDAFRICQERIAARELRMRLVDVECQFDRNRITFYFTAEKRVDFRELVKDLAATFKTRIELRQIGVRDEARRMGGYGVCGKKYCCSTFLKEFEPVTLRMAKEQQLSLSPTKISGACGRLMCCLMYEVDFYRNEVKKFPKVGTKLQIGDTELTVMRLDFFGGAVFAQDAAGVEKRISLDQVPAQRQERPPMRRRKGPRRNGEGWRRGSEGSRRDGEVPQRNGNDPPPCNRGGSE
jgi:cell fate regulator YaaT (PSP1 superfamily)